MLVMAQGLDYVRKRREEARRRLRTGSLARAALRYAS